VASPLIDLDAARRESAHPDGLPVRFKGADFLLPAELPLDTLSMVLTHEKLDLPGLIANLADKPGGTVGGDVVNALLSRPDLPGTVLDVFQDALRELFGEEEFQRFKELRPSVPDFMRLIKALMSMYGVGLGEAFRSLMSSNDAGATSKPTSPASTPASTPEQPSDSPAPASSEPAV
jgi:hypothetical protein